MAHFAQLDENNVVTQVIVVANAELIDVDGRESEAKGIAFCQSLFGADTCWAQTSYNGNIRKRYAGIGYTFYPDLDAFVTPKPEQHPSWILDNLTADWIPPIPYPTDGKFYIWNEANLNWVAVPTE